VGRSTSPGQQALATEAHQGIASHGKDTQKEAYRLFNELMAEGADTLPAPNKIHMSDLLAAFLEHAATTVKQRTFEWYKSFIVSSTNSMEAFGLTR